MLFSSCSEGTPQVFTIAPEHQPVGIAYDTSEGTNPYLTDALVVHQLGSLLYTSLFVLDESLSPNPQLAASVIAEDVNTTYRITIKNDFVFEDFSSITIQDVAASLVAAQSSIYYSQRLSNISSVSVEDDSLLIKLSVPDAFFTSLLTMPILKSVDVYSKSPLASGDYHIDTNSLTLVNEKVNSDIGEILLVDLSQPQAMADGLNMGLISVLDTTFLPNFVPASNLSKSIYPTTEMMFIGFWDEGFSTSERLAISSIIPRDEIVEDVFGDVGVPSSGIISPVYEYCEEKTQTTATNLDREYTLLYNAENASREAVVLKLEAAFAANGTRLNTIAARDLTQFEELLLLGEYDIYLADILLPENLDFSFFLDESSPGYSPYASDELQLTYSLMKSDGKTVDFCQAFAQEQPIAPIMFKEGTVYHPEWLTGLSPQNANPYYRFFEVIYD